MLTLAFLFFTQSVLAQETTPTDALFEALRDDDVVLVKSLVGKTVNLVNAASTTETALTYSIKRSTVEMVKTLLDLGANPNQAQPVSQFTPLMVAAKHQNTEAVQLLLEHNANVNITGTFGRNPLHVAALHDSLEVAHILLKTNIQINTRGNLCPLAVASRQGYLNFVNALLTEAKEKPTAKCLASAKDMATYNNHQEVLILLNAVKI